MRSSLAGGSSSGGVHTAVSLKAGAIVSGSITGDQCEVAATRPKGSALSGLERLRILPPASSTPSGRILSCFAAHMAAVQMRDKLKAIAATAVPEAKRLE